MGRNRRARPRSCQIESRTLTDIWNRLKDNQTAKAALFSDVVNIGIGSSKLGPAMATLSLAPYHDGPRCHFVANIDSIDVPQGLMQSTPAVTGQIACLVSGSRTGFRIWYLTASVLQTQVNDGMPEITSSRHHGAGAPLTKMLLLEREHIASFDGRCGR